jgi:hypothetical protein
MTRASNGSKCKAWEAKQMQYIAQWLIVCGRRVNKRQHLKVAFLLGCFKELSYLSVQSLLSFTYEHLVKPTRKPRDAQMLGSRSPGHNMCGSSI